MADIKEALGIPNFGPWYLNMTEDQDIIEEMIKLKSFIASFIKSNTSDELKGDTIDIQFINYGKTQLVFVVTIDNSKQYTLLVNQPATIYGVGKKEYNNLNILNQVDPNLVIKPIEYYENDNHELYMTPYYHQARCVGVESTDWGIWVPEPSYHFENFDNDQRRVINTSMIAMLIKLYDDINKKGLSKCRLDGGDFMLLKGYENNEISFDNIIKHLKLIAARELVSISLDDYINRIRIELANKEESNLIVIGKKLRQPFTEEEIETGIEMGLALRNQNKQYKIKRS